MVGRFSSLEIAARQVPACKGVSASVGEILKDMSAIMTIWEHKRYEDRMAIDPVARNGKPIINSTRVPLEIILGSLAGGMEIYE